MSKMRENPSSELFGRVRVECMSKRESCENPSTELFGRGRMSTRERKRRRNHLYYDMGVYGIVICERPN